jgi:methyltransferase (TIGR00027 family)
MLLASDRLTGTGTADDAGVSSNHREASRTAVLVCQGRAVAQGRMAQGRFEDPVAELLLRPAERAAVERARASVPPKGWTDRIEFETLRANAEVMAARTVAIDDAIRERPNPQLVVLGAGLDDRAWRMSELAQVDVYEVDQPASQQDKRERAASLQARARSIRFIPLDFGRDSLGPALSVAGHEPELPTTWIWEGVVPYLSPRDVEGTVTVVAQRSAEGSRLVVNYQVPSVWAWVGRVAAAGLAILARRPDPMRHERRRSAWTPSTMSSLLAGHGLAVIRDDDLLTWTERLGTPARHPRSLRNGRVAVADRGVLSVHSA